MPCVNISPKRCIQQVVAAKEEPFGRTNFMAVRDSGTVPDGPNARTDGYPDVKGPS